jgi:hypothetical protein
MVRNRTILIIIILIAFKINVLSRVLVTETGFGLVIGFINNSLVVTAINYNTS